MTSGSVRTKLIASLEHVEFRTGMDGMGGERRYATSPAVHVRTTMAAIALGVQTVRNWVKDPARSSHRQTSASSTGLVFGCRSGRPPRHRGLDACPRAEDATVSLTGWATSRVMTPESAVDSGTLA